MRKVITSNPVEIIKYAIYGLFAVLPLIVTSATVESFEFPKTLFIYVSVFSIFLWFLIVKDSKIKLPATPFVAFLVIYFVASVASSHFYTSLWGYYSRFNGGLVSVLCFFLLHLVIKNIFTKEDFSFLKLLLVVCSIPVSLYAVWQHIVFNVGTPLVDFVRVYSTLGQANWLGAYLGVIAMLCFGFISFYKNNRMWPFFICVFVLTFAGMWFTFSLSSLLGFIIGIVYWFVGFKLNYKKSLVALGICAVIVVMQPGIWKARFSDLLKSASMSQVVYAQDSSEKTNKYIISDSGKIRTEVWKGTLRLAILSTKNLLIGTGPETFPYAFQKVRPESLNYSSEWDFILNKPHNYYLEMFSSSGIIGLIAYMWIILWAFIRGNKQTRPAFLVMAITNIFSWPTSVINLLFWGLSAEDENL